MSSAIAAAGAPSTIPILKWHACYERRWERLITAKAFSHPAKFSYGLIDRIVRHGLMVGWWKTGEVIGDPFGGVMTGGIVAAYHGLRWVGVELEHRFVHLGLANAALHKKKWIAGKMPLPILLQGDSRRFAEIVAGASAILTSPPYAPNVKSDRTGAERDARSGHTQGKGCFKSSESYGDSPGQIVALRDDGGLNAVLTSPPYAEGLGRGGGPSYDAPTAEKAIAAADYGDTAGQIGNASTGDLDAVISSPPFLAARSDTTGNSGGIQVNGHTGRGGVDLVGGRTFLPGSACDRSPGNIEALPPGDGVDAILTSPPYAGSLGDGGPDRPNPDGYKRKTDWTEYGSSDGQIEKCRLGDIDAVVTSPPWEDQESAMNAGKFKDPTEFAKQMSARDGAGARNSTNRSGRMAQFSRATQTTYGESTGQMGNTVGETYWQAMDQVYRQCWLAMKPGGVMAVVVKDYVKDHARVALCDQTLRLLEHVGFEPVCRIHAMLVAEQSHAGLFHGEPIIRRKSRKSFFRRLAEKKGSPAIDWEEVLVVRKGAA